MKKLKDAINPVITIVLLILIAFILINYQYFNKTSLDINSRNVYTAKDNQGKDQFAFSVSAPILMESDTITIDPKQAFSSFIVNTMDNTINLPALADVPDNAKITILTNIVGSASNQEYVMVDVVADGDDQIIENASNNCVRKCTIKMWGPITIIKNNSEYWSLGQFG